MFKKYATPMSRIRNMKSSSSGYDSSSDDDYDYGSSSSQSSFSDYDAICVFEDHSINLPLGARANISVSGGSTIYLNGSIDFNSRWASEYDIKRVLNSYINECASICSRRGYPVRVISNISIYKYTD
ncbi:MAG: hypothetical protein IJY62_04765 [Clostridia bacterium]|nr:hypothetical protein [Clostridia bacterium]